MKIHSLGVVIYSLTGKGTSICLREWMDDIQLNKGVMSWDFTPW